ncbi:hypothetical protein [Streptomyces sp. NPDC085540]|uniref:hypothetical protein n=1 Tax=Streptomyces sp. NPDC085540 TaxID=3365730 RepID=UPI0037D905A1
MDIPNWVVPAAAAFGGITGAFITGTFTRLTGARAAEVTLQTMHAKEQLEALAAYAEHLRAVESGQPEIKSGYMDAYHRAALLSPTAAIEDAVEQAHALWLEIRSSVFRELPSMWIPAEFLPSERGLVGLVAKPMNAWESVEYGKISENSMSNWRPPRRPALPRLTRAP